MTEIAEDFTRVSDLVIMQENKFKVYKNHSGLINPCENNGPCDQHMPNSLCVLQPLHHKDDVITSKCICKEGYENLYKNGTCIPNNNLGQACDQLDCHRGHW